MVIVQEAIQSMRQKKGPMGWMAIKVHLEKAYNCLSWDFIRDTLILANMHDPVVSLTMDFVTSHLHKFFGMEINQEHSLHLATFAEVILCLSLFICFVYEAFGLYYQRCYFWWRVEAY